MTTHSATSLDRKWLDSETLSFVRPEVRNILESTQAYKDLSPDQQKQIAQSMVKVAAYMSNPDGLAEKAFEAEGNGVLARTQAGRDPTTIGGQRATEDPGFAGQDFEPGAIEAGVEQFGQLVQKVDFPNFVSGLIQGVFQAIVESSIQQMQAYGELLANVAKTVDQFAHDNITENNTRDWMQERFPDVFGLETNNDDFGFGFADGDAPSTTQVKLKVVAEDETEALQRVSKDLGLQQPITSISDPAEETRLITAARLEIARGRQQLLASMVMLGINRIVVTDGLIHAKVVFDMRASDVARRASRASFYDKNSLKTQTRAHARYGGWFSPVNAGMSSSVDTEHVTTVQSSLDETSESRADVKAKLSGEVRVNFKSDYLPMEKMATPQMIAAIQGNAEPRDKNGTDGQQQQ